MNEASPTNKTNNISESPSGEAEGTPNSTVQTNRASSKAVDRLSNDTPEIPGNQVKPDAAEAYRKGLTEKLDSRHFALSELLTEKECLQFHYVHKNASRAYYAVWQQEANKMLTVLVNLKHRRSKYLSKS